MKNYKVRIQSNKKDFQILENNILIIKGSRPKWYSSSVIFFYNNKTFEIKKVSFWKSKYSLTRGGIQVGKIIAKSLKGYFIQIFENNKIKQEYTVLKTTKSMWSSERLYTVLINENEILKIGYKWLKHSWIKYTEDFSIEVIKNDEATPELIVYSLFVMRLMQQAEAVSSSSGAMVYG